MKQVTLRIKEGRFRFFMELVKSLEFVTIVDAEDSREDVLANVKQGLKEAELIQAGKLKGRPAQRLLDEL